jgi:trk system potassium uptake protein TrkA
MKRFAIVGLGNFGSSVAEALYSHGHDVLALDVDGDAVDRMASHCSRAAVGDGRQIETLRELGADQVDAAVVSTGDDITASILTTLALKDLGVQAVYVKVISDNHARVMRKLSVTETIFPERESGFNLANRISDQSVLNYVRLARDLSFQEMIVPKDWRGHTLRELEVRTQFDVTVVGIHETATNTMVVPPNPDETLSSTDTLLVAGTDAALEAVAERANPDA